jgi:endonuclease/exonuclease/phosphatase family metal-dependent hydrolase
MVNLAGMRSLHVIILLFAVLAMTGCHQATPEGAVRDELTVLTYNLWHGLNPVGLIKFQEYETPAQREARLQGFYGFVRELDPDILFLQEVNPAPGLSRRIGKDLGYDAVHVIDNAGLKIGSLGFPMNFRSGQAILAKPDLGLTTLGHRKLSGGFGWTSWHSAFQYSEFRDALAAAVTVNGRRLLLMGIHTHHGPAADADIQAALNKLVADGAITEARRLDVLADFGEASARRRGEFEAALDLAAGTGLAKGPFLFAGDFNAAPETPELKWLTGEVGFTSTTDDADPATRLITWDYRRNENTHYFADFVPVNEFEPAVMQVVNPLVVQASKRLDYVLHRGLDGWLTVAESGLFADRKHEGHFASDHFGIYTKFILAD